MKTKQRDPSRGKTHPLETLSRKVGRTQLAQVIEAGASMRAFLDALPDVLAAHELRELARRIAAARRSRRTVLLQMGAHPLKVGLGPVICALIRDGIITAIAGNGATLIHDFELAYAGRTSEDVGVGLADGNFGMAEETGAILNEFAKIAALEGRGYGEIAGREMRKRQFKFADSSIFATAYDHGIPITVHVTLGADIIHMHPDADGAAIGAATMADFHRLVTTVAGLSHGVVINLGSAVIMPEVFMKALNLARNLGHQVGNFTATDMDFVRHYRPAMNVVARPTQTSGQGIMLTGHHEIMFPLLAAAVREELSSGTDRTESQVVLTAEDTAGMGGAFTEALELVRNEFQGLDLHQQYQNAFARLLKHDPLNRVLMLGTDQRDLFIPKLRDRIRTTMLEGSRVFDIGCGDGQTFGLIAEDLPKETTIDYLDPNPAYMKAFKETVALRRHLKLGLEFEGEFPVIFATQAPPRENSIDLVLAIHVLYFFEPLEDCLLAIYRYLKPHRAAFIVFADEETAYTGRAAHAYYKSVGRVEDQQRQERVLAERRKLFLAAPNRESEIQEILQQTFPETKPEIQIEIQDSRLYGHSLADIIALCNIAELAAIEDSRKFESAAQLLRTEPDAVGLRIEGPGTPRAGMFSVRQPQALVSITKG